MMCVKVSLNDIKKVMQLVTVLSNVDSDFDLISDRYVVDAKSILGALSLDLSRPVDLYVYSADEEIHRFVLYELTLIGALE